MPQNLIQIQNLTKYYRTGFAVKPKKAIEDVSLSVQKGDVYGFIGPNGAGKSTTIKIIVGLLRYSQGDVNVLGNHPKNPSTRSRIGYCPEHPYFYDDLTGWELLEFYGRMSGIKGSDLKRKIKNALEKLHADQDWIHSKLRSYSKGMVQRVGIAQAILNEPELLILDEPMSGLDPVGRKDVREAILNLNQQGTTIFYSSHVLADVEAISSRIGMIIGGKMRHEGPMEEILNQSTPQYHVVLADSILESELPFAGLELNIQRKVLCPTPELKDQFLSWAISNNKSIESVDRTRFSLEEILTREIAHAR